MKVKHFCLFSFAYVFVFRIDCLRFKWRGQKRAMMLEKEEGRINKAKYSGLISLKIIFILKLHTIL